VPEEERNDAFKDGPIMGGKQKPKGLTGLKKVEDEKKATEDKASQDLRDAILRRKKLLKNDQSSDSDDGK